MNVPEGFVLVPTDPIKAIDMGWAYLDAAREAEPNKSHSFSHAGYRAMIAAAPTVDLPAYDEAKERELFELEFEKPLSANFAVDEYRYMGQVGRPEMVLFIEFVGSWEGWKKCAKSRARSAE